MEDIPVPVDAVQFDEPLNEVNEATEAEAITEVIYHCHICMEAFVCEDIFRLHMDNHTSEMPFECKVCGVRFIDDVNLKKHSDMKHAKDDAYEACPVCGKFFHDKANLKSHMAVHSENRPFVCGICNRGFKRKGELESHCVMHTGVKPYKCKLCNKSYTQKYTLKTHMRIHTGEKPFKCSICGKEFNRSSTVTLHMRQHTGEKPYQCTECKENFKFYRDLKKHRIKVHSKEETPKTRIIPRKRGRKPKKMIKNTQKTKEAFECAVCQKEFDSMTSFNEHIKSHDVDVCYLCGQKLKNKVDKKRHVTRPIEIKIKKCECYTCGVKFTKLEDFKFHMNGHSELCRLEECLKNAEKIHRLSNKSHAPKSTKPHSEDEDGGLDEDSDQVFDNDKEGDDLSMSPINSYQENEKNLRSDVVTVKQEQGSGDDKSEEPETTVLELVERGEGLQLKTPGVELSPGTAIPKVEFPSVSLDLASLAAVNLSDSDSSPEPRKLSRYKVARVSPPRTRGSLRVRFKESPERSTEPAAALPKIIENGLSPCRESSVTDGEDSDDCDLAETYSIYVKNILRLQPFDKQMALIKCINTTIGKFIND